MKHRKNSYLLIQVIFLPLFFFACGSAKKPPEEDIVKQPEQLEAHTRENIRTILKYAAENGAKINDTLSLRSFSMVDQVYRKHNYEVIWSDEDRWQPLADSMFHFIEHAKEYGLFPSDYYLGSLNLIRSRFLTDSVSKKDAALWTRADLMLTDAYFNIARHLKLGRLERDSTMLKADSAYDDSFFIGYFNKALESKSLTALFQELEPKYEGYQKIKAALPAFLDSATFANYTYLTYPYKDSLQFIGTVEKRLAEAGYFDMATDRYDSSLFAAAVRSYQGANGFKQTGRINAALVKYLNNHDWEKFKRIAVTLDRYKLLPDSVSRTYALVNIPAYYLYVYEEDTLALKSRVIVGAPKTKTPLLYSEISNFITYPQWTVPYSIVFKEMLPQIKRDITYLQRQNLMVVDKADSVIDPVMIDWSKLNKNYFPYLLRQRQGDDNSLGVIKFNFRNKYSVYLHDTNARWLFSKTERALSHGCVRVQEWQKLSRFLVRRDTLRFPSDTLTAWINRQEKHVVSGFPKLPLFIRYFTIDADKGQLKFYEDVYGQDEELIRKFFAAKPVA
jgi:L,D-transpeptidase YcbB